MVAGPRNHFVIHEAGILDSGLLLATAGGLFIGSHTFLRKLFSAFSLAVVPEQCQFRSLNVLERLPFTQEFAPVRRVLFILGSHRVEDSCLSPRAGLFSASMLSSVLVSRETIVLSQLPLRRPSSRLFPPWKALATESQ